ncbi:hypothetical protein Tco_0123469, partial [Tanacetum coccineum]
MWHITMNVIITLLRSDGGYGTIWGIVKEGNVDKVVVMKKKIQAVRDRQKSYASSGHKLVEYEIGDKVLLKVSPWRGVMCFGKKKLSPRYVGPFEILERIGPVAYLLRLPEELADVHDTFRVSNLRKCLAKDSLHVSLDEIKIDKTLCFIKEPVEIMDCDVTSLKRSRIPIVKVRWNSKRGPKFTWEREEYMKSKYPQLFVDRVDDQTSSELGSELTLLTGSELKTSELDTSELKTSKYRTNFASWQQRIRLYCQGKENAVILKSIDEGTFQMGTIQETLAERNEGALHLGPVRPRIYSDLSPEDKERYNADIRATNILLQGLPKDIYSLINRYTDAKDIWDNVKMLLEGSKLTKEDRESQLYDDFEHFRQNKGETI